MKQCDLRTGVDTNGGPRGPEAAIDIQVGVPETIEALGVCAQQMSEADAQSQRAHLDLSPMIMSGQGEGDIASGSLRKDFGAMGQQYGWKRRIQVVQRLMKIGPANAQIVDPRNGKRTAIGLHNLMGIVQHGDPRTLEGADDLCGLAVPMVMISKDGETPVPALDPCHLLNTRRKIGR